MIGATVGVSLQTSLLEPSLGGFHFENEGFFGTHTYAGGADKAAHFVDYAITYRLLDATYGEIGYSGAARRWLAFGTSAAAGLATEIGDGTTVFGFSWQDFFMDVLGAGIEMELSHTGWDDTIGFRYGSHVSQSGTPQCCRTDDIGRDYSGEMYTADLKLSGLSQRLRMDVGPARYLLFSLTYGSNGYRHAPPEWQQRLIGVELGIHFSEILRSVGVSDRTIWGQLLYLFFDSVRIPYTAIGVRYDLNQREWFVPTTGRTTRSP